MLNTKGAATKIGCGDRWLRKLVQDGRIPAYTYNDNGELVKLDPTVSHQGKDMCFLESDLEAFQPKPRGRPQGSRDRETSTKRRKLKKFPGQQ
jgi:hypothetical protein